MYGPVSYLIGGTGRAHKGRIVNVLLFGATGMVGQGVLRECLLAPDVERVQTVGRSATGQSHPKLRELVHGDLWNYSAVETQLTPFDACFFCLGVASAGMSEADYTRLTYDLTLAAARTLARLNPAMTFIFVSGMGTDSSEQGGLMWARVKGRTENALQRLRFKAAYAFRPGLIQPLHGITSRTPAYRLFYTAAAPLMPLARRLFPNTIVTTEQVGKAMLNVVRRGWPTPILEQRDIARASA
jgi:uncharacterized protein YbjT (DUF2867 family)